MIATNESVTVTALESTITYHFQENGFIKTINMILPNFTTAASVSQIDVKDEEGYAVYTSTTGWADNGTRTVGSLSIPVDKGFTLVLTLNAASGGTHTAKVKTYINTQE